MRGVFFCLLLLLSSFLDKTQACGVLTHGEITMRAFMRFTTSNYPAHKDLVEMMGERPGPLLAGAFFPDWAYLFNPIRELSDYAHWPRFFKHAFEYLNAKYSKPWKDDKAKDLIVFMFGAISHMVADIDWHGLLYPQSIIHCMASRNFGGKYPDAHSFADVVGEFQLGRASNIDYNGMEKWRYPTKEIVEIYHAAGYQKCSIADLEKGMGLGYLAGQASVRVRDSVFRQKGQQSAIFVEHYEDFPVGGIDQLSSQVMDCWLSFAKSLKTGTWEACPLLEHFMSKYAQEEKQAGRLTDLTMQSAKHPPNLKEPTMGQSIINTLQGFAGSLVRGFNRMYHYLWSNPNMLPCDADLVLWENGNPKDANGLSPYAGMGASIAYSPKSNLLAVGMPRWTGVGLYQAGSVLLFKLKSGGKQADLVQTIRGTEPGAQLGLSLVFADLNKNGQDELVISAPYTKCSDDPLYSCGKVMVYKQGSTDGQFRLSTELGLESSSSLRPLFFGHQLTRAGNDAVIIGSPYLTTNPDKFQQGAVHLLLGGKGLKNLNLGAPLTQTSINTFAWFGWSSTLITIGANRQAILAIGIPGQGQSGSVTFFNWINKAPIKTINGPGNGGQFGASLVWMPKQQILVIGSPSEECENQWQAGCIRLLSLKDNNSIPENLDGKQRICGTDLAGHFGWTLAVNEQTNQLFVSARSREKENGAVFVYDVDDNGQVTLVKTVKGAFPQGRLGNSLLAVTNLEGCELGLGTGSPSASPNKNEMFRPGNFQLRC